MKFVPIKGPRGPEINWNKIHNSLRVWFTSRKTNILYVFKHGNGGLHGIGAFWNFSSKSGCQKYGAWIPGDPIHAYES